MSDDLMDGGPMVQYRTVVYSTVRAEIVHDTPFDNKEDALEWIMGQSLLDYGSIVGGCSEDGAIRVVDVEVVTDELQDYNIVEL
jgi:hypothetical protein